MRRRVVITGIGVINPLGANVETMWQALCEGKSGVDYTTVFDASRFPTKFSSEVRNWDYRTAGLDPDTTGELPLDDIRGWVAWNAVANVASIAQQILDREGVTNQSESMDGLSRSYGVDIGKPGGRFARLLSSPSVAAMIGKDGRDFLLREIKPLVHPLRIY